MSREDWELREGQDPQPVWSNGWRTTKDKTWHEQNVELWRKTQSPAAMLEFNMGLVQKVVGIHMRKTKSHFMEDELMQAACEGFLKVFERKTWDERHSIATFASWDMIASMQRAQRDAIHSFGTVPWEGVQGRANINEVVPRTVSRHVPHVVRENEELDVSLGAEDPEFERAERQLDLSGLLEQLAGALSDGRREHFLDWVEERQREELGATMRCALKWGITRQAAETRIRRALNDVRKAYPELVNGPPSLRPQWAGLRAEERRSLQGKE